MIQTKVKLHILKFPTENVMEAYLYLPQEWWLQAEKILRNFISSILKTTLHNFIASF